MIDTGSNMRLATCLFLALLIIERESASEKSSLKLMQLKLLCKCVVRIRLLQSGGVNTGGMRLGVECKKRIGNKNI